MKTEQRVQVEVSEKDLAIRKAIRELKEEIKVIALQQKEERRSFRQRMSEWDKTPYAQRAVDKAYPPYFSNMATTLTLKLIIYGQLRNRPHLTVDALNEYFNGIPGRYLPRKQWYKQKLNDYKKAHPETAELLSEEIMK